MATIPMKEPVTMSDFATTMLRQTEERRAFYVGIDMRTPAHDYQKLHYLLMHYRAEKASPRIWQLALTTSERNVAVSLLRKCLAAGDEMIVADVPHAMSDPERLAA